MRTVTLADLIALLSDAGQLVDTTAGANAAASTLVTGLSCDSRVVEPGHVFACKGVSFRDAFLGSALSSGAVAYLADAGLAPGLTAAYPKAMGIVVRDVRVAMGMVAPVAWGHPDEDLRIVGVTGTKGKSTVTYMLRSILDVAAGREGATALIGSIETYDGVERTASINTTPEAPDLWRHLAHARAAGLHDVVMEVSSQALKYHRVDGLGFDVAAFTNPGRDHISPIEHPTLEDYVASKLRIFEQAKVGVVNARGERASAVLSAARAGCGKVVTFDAAGDVGADVYATDARATVNGRGADADAHEGGGCYKTGDADGASAHGPAGATTSSAASGAFAHGGAIGSTFVAHAPTWEATVVVPLPGDFNVENALAAIAVADVMGVEPDAIAKGLAKTVVPGRMEIVEGSHRDGVTGIVDFAHNAMALERFFPAVRAAWPDAAIIAVFGATGDKGVERRREMPAVAANWADHLIFTEDDAGAEPVASICEAMVAAVGGRVPCEVVPDRAEATERAVALARSLARPAVVCLLGRGTEPTMHRGQSLVPFPLDADLLRGALCA